MKRAGLIMTIIAAAALGGFGAVRAAAGEVVEVRIQQYMFLPEKLTVKAGTTVRWTNHEKRASHSIWFKDEGLPESERMLPGESWERTFDKPGTYPYTCGPHPEMNAVVEVTP
jgi:plastocyanin